jgi:hypothetical protein
LQYDDQLKAVKEIEHTLTNIDKRSTSTFKENEVMRAELQTMRSDLNDIKERHLDLQSRSMRDNLIFDGIPGTHEEDPEVIIKDFIRKEMEITDNMEFHRVHRMGRKNGHKHRPIIAKFVLHKDKERVRRAAPGTLRGKPYGVNEQFPKEINERRKQLYPQYKAAKRQGKRASLISTNSTWKDDLYATSHRRHHRLRAKTPEMRECKHHRITKENHPPDLLHIKQRKTLSN